MYLVMKSRSTLVSLSLLVELLLLSESSSRSSSSQWPFFAGGFSVITQESIAWSCCRFQGKQSWTYLHLLLHLQAGENTGWGRRGYLGVFCLLPVGVWTREVWKMRSTPGRSKWAWQTHTSVDYMELLHHSSVNLIYKKVGLSRNHTGDSHEISWGFSMESWYNVLKNCSRMLFFE